MPVMILNDETSWEPAPEQVAKWKLLYQAVDVDGELNAMVGWLDANPKKRKTSRGIATFCNNWLKRAQDKGGQGMAKQPSGTIKTRDMTSLDDLSHNFTNCPQMEKHFIEIFGQSFNSDGTRVLK